MRLAALLGALVLAAPAGAQVEARRAPGWCVLEASTRAAEPRVPGRLEAVAPPGCDPATEGAVFEVTYSGFPPGAEAAFQAAVDTWACRVRSDQVIRVDASWEALAPGTLGSAGPFLFRSFDAAPTRDVWFPAALADALSGRDLGGGDADVEAFFNSEFSDWHVGLGPAPEDRYDLYTVVLHELGHGLGLIGSLRVEDGLGEVGVEPEGPFAYDLHATDPRGVPLLDAATYPDGTLALAAALQDEVRFDGRAVGQAVGRSVPLYTPPRWVQGGSYSHLDEEVFGAGTPDGLMTPFIARGETVAEPGPVVCAMLADVGWALAGPCADAVGALPPVSPEVVVERRGPNPTASRTAFRVTSAEPVSVRPVLYDALGRRVRAYPSSVVAGGGALEVVVEAAGLAAGVYVLSVEGGPEPVRVALTVVR